MKVLSSRSTKVLAMASILLIVSGTLAFAEYDQEKVVGVMRNNIDLMGGIGEAAAAEEWFLAAQGLYTLAEGMMGIMKFTPPRGSQADYEATMVEFINAAFRGIGACGAGDKEALEQAIGELRALNRQGHGNHKPR